MKAKKDPPKTKTELNSEVYFNVNLKNEINWQPMHIEISPIVNFVILGQYTAFKEVDGFKIDLIDFYLYNSNNLNELYIKKVDFLKDEKGIIELNVLLDDKKGDVDSYPFKDQRLKSIENEKIIDLHLFYKNFDTPFNTNELFNSKESQKKEIFNNILNIGHHICKSLVINPNS